MVYPSGPTFVGRRTGPLPHPTTLKYTVMGGRVGERAGAAIFR